MYHDDPLKWDDSRYLHRGKLNWDHVAMREDLSTRQGQLFQAIKKLQILRASYDVFDSNADTWIVEPWNDHILGIGRYYNDQKLIALFNFADDEQTAWIDEPEDFIELMTGEKREAKAVQLPPHGFVWLFHSYKENKKTMTAPDLEALTKPKKKAPAKKAAKKATAKKTVKAKAAKKETKTEVKTEVKETKAAAKTVAAKKETKPAAKAEVKETKAAVKKETKPAVKTAAKKETKKSSTVKKTKSKSTKAKGK